MEGLHENDFIMAAKIDRLFEQASQQPVGPE
jgi:pterin-4a-carbinolamine dehydratase